MLTHIYMTSWGLAFYSHIRNNCNNHIIFLVGEALIHKISLISSLVIEVPVPSQESRLLCIFVLGHRFCMFLRFFDSFVELFCRYSRMYIAFFNSFRQYIIFILATDYACHRLIGTGNRNIQRKQHRLVTNHLQNVITSKQKELLLCFTYYRTIIAIFYIIQNCTLCNVCM